MSGFEPLQQTGQFLSLGRDGDFYLPPLPATEDGHFELFVSFVCCAVSLASACDIADHSDEVSAPGARRRTAWLLE